MSDLLPYYNRELAYLRRLGAEFSAAHPKVAGRLRMAGDAIEDPHVSRLVESVAFLNARVRKSLDDGFPELTQALLSVLYPHFLAPVPSMAIVQLECDPELGGSYEVPRGTPLETERIDGQAVRFRTCTPARLWPIRVARARLEGLHPRQGVRPRAPGCASVLQFELETCTEGQRFATLLPRSLRFFLRAPAQQAFALYELLFNDTLEVAVADSARDEAPVRLGAAAIRAVGFERDEGMLPYPARSFPGYRLLTEYFAFPARFLFFDLDLPEAKVRQAGRKLELHFFLRSAQPDLQQLVTAETLALGCAPVVNLFRKRAEPLRLTQAESEFRVVADARRPRAVEVYSIDRVQATSPAGERMEFRPFYGLEHGGEGGRGVWWSAARRAAPGEDRQDRGTEVYLALVDLSNRSAAPDGWVLEVDTTCLSRDLPARLPVAPGLTLSEGGGPIRSIRCLTQPTATLRRETGDAQLWKLVSHLTLNHLSLSGGQARESLQEILRLYDVGGSGESREVVEGVLEVRTRERALRVSSGGQPGFARGMEVGLHLDEGRFAGHGLYLFGSVVERFLSLYASLNSFVQLVLTSNQRSGEVHRWPPRAGDHPLL